MMILSFFLFEKVYEAEVHQLKTDKISNILSEINFSRIIRAQEKPRDVLLQELQPIQTAWKALPEEQRESDFSSATFKH